MGRKRSASSSLSSEIKDYIPQFIIGFFIVLTGVIFIHISTLLSYKDNFDENLWKKAYENVEKSKVGLNIVDITTTLDEYEQLRQQSNKFIEAYGIKPDAKLNVDVNVSNEKLFIDGNKYTVNSYEENEIIETGPIYFQDKLLIRYISEAGDIKIVLAYKNKQTGNINVLNQSEIATVNNFTIKKIKKEGLLDETEYVDAIRNSLIQVLNLKEDKKLMSILPLYYTYDCSKYLLNIRNDIVKKGDNLNIVYTDFGKSDTSISQKNRIFIQIKSMDKLINIILKLNNNYKVFDVDII